MGTGERGPREKELERDMGSRGSQEHMMGMLGPSLLASLLPVHPPPQPHRLGSLPRACWGLSGPFNMPGPPHLLRLPQVSQQKPPFAWLWNQPLGEQMRQQLDQLQGPSAHSSVPGQAWWHPAKLFRASLTAWSPSHVVPMGALHGGASEELEARSWPCQPL